MADLPYNDLNNYLRNRFGCRVQKITIDAGLTCPNRDGTLGTGGCIYCNERGSGTGRYGAMSITGQIDAAREVLSRRYGAIKYIAYFQSFTNTYAPVDTLHRFYSEALAAGDDIAGLIIGTRPDCVDDDVLDMIAEIAGRTYVTLEYGLQSVHDRTLDHINRGHRFAAFADAVERTRSRGIDAGVHVILGLPGESRDDMLETARVLGGIDLQGIKIHLLYVVRGTPLHELYEAGGYECLTREEYADIVCDFLGWLPPAMVIHRLTGDPHPEELVAPLWALEKQKNRRAILNLLDARGIRQGIYRGER